MGGPNIKLVARRIKTDYRLFKNPADTALESFLSHAESNRIERTQMDRHKKSKNLPLLPLLAIYYVHLYLF